MADTLDKRIQDALRTVLDPEMRIDLVTAGMVKRVEVSGSDAQVEIELTTPACPLKEQIEREVRAALALVVGLKGLELSFSARVRSGAAPAGAAPIAGIQNIVAVGSGKGGVGKSTVASNVAVSLARDGARVGLMDADIHGPSVAMMFGLASRQPEARGKRIVPFEVPLGGGMTPLKVMSMAFFLEDGQPVVWRGPMLHKVLQQFLHDVDWGELDYLVIDLPPGTGDVQISLSQLVPIAGALIVTTPQDVALLDVRKAVTMFKKVNVPVLGVVENMGAFECPGCHAVHPIFGEGGGKAFAEEVGVPFLGTIPLAAEVRVAGDSGRPLLATETDSAAGRALREAARRLAGQLSLRARAGYTHELRVL